MFRVRAGYIEMHGARIANLVEGADERLIREEMEDRVTLDDDGVYGEDAVHEIMRETRDEVLGEVDVIIDKFLEEISASEDQILGLDKKLARLRQ